MVIDNIPNDKLKHLFAGVILSLSYFITEFFKTNHLWALSFCAAVAIGNEIYQKINKKGTPEIADILFTMIVPVMFYLFTLI